MPVAPRPGKAKLQEQGLWPAVSRLWRATCSLLVQESAFQQPDGWSKATKGQQSPTRSPWPGQPVPALLATAVADHDPPGHMGLYGRPLLRCPPNCNGRREAQATATATTPGLTKKKTGRECGPSCVQLPGGAA